MIMSILDCLNPQQKEAVIYTDSPLLVIAGAGSGKTKVITHKIAYLLSLGVQPGNILALTFTNKASDEMKRRVSQVTGKNFHNLWIMTFHAFSARILRIYGKIIGISPDFSIIDRDDQRKILKEILISYEIGEGRAYANTLVEKISYTKGTFCFYPHEELLYQRGFREREVEIFNQYQKELKRLNCFDFDELILKTIELLQTHESKVIKERFKYILIDEFQDTSPSQYEIVKLFSSQFITAVGDEDQSIYSWRGANLEHILQFEQDFPDARIVKLEENYRSTKSILMGAQEVIVKNSKRRAKNLYTNNPHGEPIICFIAKNPAEEAHYIAEEIKRIEKESKNLMPVAIFYRVNQQSRIIEEALTSLRIPYKVIGGIKFYERKEIKDIIAILRIVLNRDDDFSFKRILSEIVEGVGNVIIQKILEYSKKEKISIYEALKNLIPSIKSPAREKLTEFLQKLDEWQELSKNIPSSELTSLIVNELNFRINLEEERWENVEELIKGIKEMERIYPDLTLRDLVDNLSLRSDSDLEEHPSVNLMTLHISKGLEFPTVFIAGVDEEVLPHRKSLTSLEKEEERRLFYVGMTRAKKRLYLTSSGKPSRFLEEIPDYLKVDGKETISKEDGVKYKIGDFVEHLTFGVGKILSIMGEGASKVLLIEFESGKKCISSNFSGLKKLSL
ncbi:MAG: ATP-dependent helicase [Candidatus Aminicenantia bacterium]